MIAELHGKISSSGSNLSDRLEDKLTGNIFGTLRYLPFQCGMAQILEAANIPELTDIVKKTNLTFWGDRIQFWPYHVGGEIDAFLELDEAVIGIEVKYNSGLSSDDEIDNAEFDAKSDRRDSCNQLARESRIVKSWCIAGKKAFLIFIAYESECAPICKDVISRSLIEPEVSLSYVSWEEIQQQLSAL